MYSIIIRELNDTITTYTTRSLKKAYAIYDSAITNGLYVESFKCGTSDMRDREQAAIIY